MDKYKAYHYGDNVLQIPGNLTHKEVLDSFSVMFPELKNGIVIKETEDDVYLDVKAGHTVLYNGYRAAHALSVESTMGLSEVKESMAEIFPEIRNMEVYNHSDGSVRFRYPTESDRQQVLDDILRRRKYDELMRKHRAEVAEIGRKVAREHLREIYENGNPYHITPSKQQLKVGIVGGDYAEIGSYQHLVGRKVQILSENQQLAVCIVKPLALEEGEEDKEYVIRTRDIKF